MSNMSYCRFQHTLDDLRGCYEDLEDRGGLSGVDSCYEEKLDGAELRAAKRLIAMCKDIASEFGEEDE